MIRHAHNNSTVLDKESWILSFPWALARFEKWCVLGSFSGLSSCRVRTDNSLEILTRLDSILTVWHWALKALKLHSVETIGNWWPGNLPWHQWALIRIAWNRRADLQSVCSVVCIWDVSDFRGWDKVTIPQCYWTLYAMCEWYYEWNAHQSQAEAWATFNHRIITNTTLKIELRTCDLKLEKAEVWRQLKTPERGTPSSSEHWMRQR